MASLWQEFVDTIDSQISVDDGLFWATRSRALLAWPFIPFFGVVLFAETPSPVVDVAMVATLIFEVWWTVFLFRRRAAKKCQWVEPTRFSDQNDGY